MATRPEAGATENMGGRVCCILVNWNGAEDTMRCLTSLESQTYADLDVLVVDNGSTDGSVERICRYVRERDAGATVRMSLVKAGANLGFARGNNLGVQAALAKDAAMVWLLNNDTECPPETLERLMAAAKRAPRAGIVGSVLFYADGPSRVQAWGGGHVWPSVAYTTHFRAARRLRRNDYLTFASVLLRPAMLQEVGLLDEDFFMYFEDVELCLRAQRAGWRLAVAADTAILHRVGGSRQGARRPALEREITVSGMRLIEKQGRWPFLGKWLFAGARLAKRASLGQWAAVRAVWDGVWMAR